MIGVILRETIQFFSGESSAFTVLSAEFSDGHSHPFVEKPAQIVGIGKSAERSNSAKRQRRMPQMKDHLFQPEADQVFIRRNSRECAESAVEIAFGTVESAGEGADGAFLVTVRFQIIKDGFLPGGVFLLSTAQQNADEGKKSSIEFESGSGNSRGGEFPSGECRFSRPMRFQNK